jgi:hypothetical protein
MLFSKCSSIKLKSNYIKMTPNKLSKTIINYNELKKSFENTKYSYMFEF